MRPLIIGMVIIENESIPPYVSLYFNVCKCALFFLKLFSKNRAMSGTYVKKLHNTSRRYVSTVT